MEFAATIVLFFFVLIVAGFTLFAIFAPNENLTVDGKKITKEERNTINEVLGERPELGEAQVLNTIRQINREDRIKRNQIASVVLVAGAPLVVIGIIAFLFPAFAVFLLFFWIGFGLFNR